MGAARKIDVAAELSDLERMFPGKEVLPMIEINGVEFGTPFAYLWGPLPPPRRAGLRFRISKVGIRQPVLTYESPRWRLCLLDGLNRCEIALELNKEVPVKHLGKMSDEAAFEEAKSAQKDRRQCTPAEIEAAMKKDVAEILEMERRGSSKRAIAAAVGVSRRKVDQALQPDTGAAGPVAGGKTFNDKVTGLDGKRRPAAPLKLVTVEKPEPSPTRDAIASICSHLEKLHEGFLAILNERALFTGTLADVEGVASLLEDVGNRMRPLVKASKTRGKFKDGTPITPESIAALLVPGGA